MSSSSSNAELARGKILYAQLIETLFNTAKQFDSYQGQLLEQFDGKVIGLQFLPLSTKVFLIINGTELCVQSEISGSADCAISAPIPAWQKLNPIIEFPDPNQTLAFDDFDIQGDEILGEKFLQSLHTLEIDWEEKLSQLTGDLIAYQIGHNVCRWRGYKKQTAQQITQTLEEYLKFEIDISPSRSEMTDWQKELQTLSDAVEQLEQRLRH